MSENTGKTEQNEQQPEDKGCRMGIDFTAEESRFLLQEQGRLQMQSGKRVHKKDVIKFALWCLRNQPADARPPMPEL